MVATQDSVEPSGVRRTGRKTHRRTGELTSQCDARHGFLCCYTAMTQSIIVFDQLVAAWIVKTVAVY